MNTLTIAQKFCVDSSKTIKQLCNYLMQKTPIATFGMNREFFDGRRITLTTKAEWTEHYLSNDYHKRLVGYETFYENEFTVWHPFSDEPMIKDARENFNICDGITLSYFNNDYVDLYHFATASDDRRMTNWYVNNLQHLKNFTHHIRQHFDSTFRHVTPYEALDKNYFAKYTSMMQKQRLIMVQPYEVVKPVGDKTPPITEREIQVLDQLTRGNTSKEAAKVLLLSPRTIEYYILKLREKFNCHTKSQLIKLVLAKKILQPF